MLGILGKYVIQAIRLPRSDYWGRPVVILAAIFKGDAAVRTSYGRLGSNTYILNSLFKRWNTLLRFHWRSHLPPGERYFG